MEVLCKCDNCGKTDQGTAKHLNENWCYDCMRLAEHCISCDCSLTEAVDDLFNYEHDECPSCRSINELKPLAATDTALR